MGICVEAPAEHHGSGPSLFLAGGISGCPDWQAEVVASLAELPLVLFNPRRRNFPIDDPSAAAAQIEWERRYLRPASAILFWFPQQTVCPIALYELGAWSMTAKPIFVGTHRDYPRRMDVVIQTQLVRPQIEVFDTLHAVIGQVRSWHGKSRKHQ
jgi:hypothetical protein